MSNIREMHEEVAKLATQARAKLDEIVDDTPEERTAEIETEFDKIMQSHDKIKERITREERLKAAQEAVIKPDTSKVPEVEDRSAPAVDTGQQMEYRHAFAEYIANGGEAYVEPEVRNVLKEYRVQVGGTNTSGGFTVPTELATFLVESMKAFGPMYSNPIFNVINDTDGRPFNIPTIDDTSVTAEAHTEGTQPTDDGGKDATFGQKSLGAFAFNTEWVRWSAELNADSVLNMESLLGRLLGE